MKTKMLASFLVIALVAAVIGGASMAYFTAKTDAPENVFVAGTVMIEAGKEFVWGAQKMDNVNPGDCFSKCVQIYNTGTKAIELRLVGMNFTFEIDWEWIGANWDALCFSNDWEGLEQLQEAVAAALAGGHVTNPAHAVGDPNGPFDGNGNLIVPVMAAPCPDSNWVMRYTADGTMEFYYAGGPLARGGVTELCVVVVFDGPWMGNLWQGATFTMGGGMFQAVQASNNAPTELWGLGWNECFLSSPAERLANKIDSAYASYFYDGQGNFLFAGCCIGSTVYVTTQEELERALANSEIERIKLVGEFDGFAVERSVIIQGGIIIPGSVLSETAGIVVAAKGVIIDGVTVKGDYPTTIGQRGIIGQDGAMFFVRNSTFLNLHTGVYVNRYGAATVVLTALDNHFHDCGAGIGGTENSLLHAIKGNMFEDCTEGVGLGIGVDSSIVDDADIEAYLVDNNTFTNCTDDVADYRP